MISEKKMTWQDSMGWRKTSVLRHSLTECILICKYLLTHTHIYIYIYLASGVEHWINIVLLVGSLLILALGFN